jgi:hypothetical protein
MFLGFYSKPPLDVFLVKYAVRLLCLGALLLLETQASRL